MAGMRMSVRKSVRYGSLRVSWDSASVRCARRQASARGPFRRRDKVNGIAEIGDAELERLLLTPAEFHGGPAKPLPGWTKVHEELKRRGVTLMILWKEHRTEHVDGHEYSRFCEIYGEWRRRLSPKLVPPTSRR
jgi:hypothetical protein